MTIENKYKKLTDVEHCLLRPGRYIGSAVNHTGISWLISDGGMTKREATWNPALVKMFDEVLSNSVDESKRKGTKLNTIHIDLDTATGEIIVKDNGGIPVELHKEANQYVPEMIFSELRAGSNFDDGDDNDLTGQNGEGEKTIYYKYVYEKPHKKTHKRYSTSSTRYSNVRTDAKQHQIETCCGEDGQANLRRM